MRTVCGVDLNEREWAIYINYTTVHELPGGKYQPRLVVAHQSVDLGPDRTDAHEASWFCAIVSKIFATMEQSNERE